MSMNITKAIIPVAGWGTRRLPVTKAIEKCMLPIGNRPVIDYVVQDCIRAGITEIFFVVNQGDRQLETYYSRHTRLEEYLNQSGKQEYIKYITPPANIKFYYIDQDSNGKYGTAIPVGMCAQYLRPGESVVVAMGDDFTYNQDGSSDIARLIATTPQGGSSMLSTEIAREAVGQFGVIEFTENGGYHQIVEKPQPDQAPSTSVNVSKYVFNYDMMQSIAAYANVNLSGEYYLTEPMNQYVLTGGHIQVVPAAGQYLNAGDPYSWLYANRVILGQ